MKQKFNLTATALVLLCVSIFSSCNNEGADTQKETEPEITYEIYEVFNTYKDENAPFLNMRSEANSDSKIVAELYDGTQLYFLDNNYGEQGNWNKVEVIETKEIGYVNGHWIRKVLTGDDRHQYYDCKTLKLTNVSCYEGNECTFEFTDNRKKYKFDWFLEDMNAEEGSFEKRFMDAFGSGYGDDPFSNLIGETFKVYYEKDLKNPGSCVEEDGIWCTHIIDLVLTEDIPKTEISNANTLYRKIEKKSIKVKFHGMGTEPFWDIYILENEVLYVQFEEPESYRLLTPFDQSAYSQKIKYESEDGQIYEVKIVKTPAGDGMSDRSYPYSVIFSEDEPWENGAGYTR